MATGAKKNVVIVGAGYAGMEAFRSESMLYAYFTARNYTTSV